MLHAVELAIQNMNPFVGVEWSMIIKSHDAIIAATVQVINIRLLPRAIMIGSDVLVPVIELQKLIDKLVIGNRIWLVWTIEQSELIIKSDETEFTQLLSIGIPLLTTSSSKYFYNRILSGSKKLINHWLKAGFQRLNLFMVGSVSQWNTYTCLWWRAWGKESTFFQD